jgi:hypothetical protein
MDNGKRLGSAHLPPQISVARRLVNIIEWNFEKVYCLCFAPMVIIRLSSVGLMYSVHKGIIP